MSCCEMNAQGHHCDCSPCGRCEGDNPRANTQQTAYDRAQQEIRDAFDSVDARISGLDRLIQQVQSRCATLETSTTPQRVVDTEHRLDAALRRIEQLELEVAKLKGPRLPEVEACCEMSLATKGEGCSCVSPYYQDPNAP